MNCQMYFFLSSWIPSFEVDVCHRSTSFFIHHFYVWTFSHANFYLYSIFSWIINFFSWQSKTGMVFCCIVSYYKFDQSWSLTEKVSLMNYISGSRLIGRLSNLKQTIIAGRHGHHPLRQWGANNVYLLAWQH